MRCTRLRTHDAATIISYLMTAGHLIPCCLDAPHPAASMQQYTMQETFVRGTLKANTHLEQAPDLHQVGPAVRQREEEHPRLKEVGQRGPVVLQDRLQQRARVRHQRRLARQHHLRAPGARSGNLLCMCLRQHPWKASQRTAEPHRLRCPHRSSPDVAVEATSMVILVMRITGQLETCVQPETWPGRSRPRHIFNTAILHVNGRAAKRKGKRKCGGGPRAPAQCAAGTAARRARGARPAAAAAGSRPGRARAAAAPACAARAAPPQPPQTRPACLLWRTQFASRT